MTLLGLLLGGLWFWSPDTSNRPPAITSPSTPAATLNGDLQLVRLYLQTDQQGWQAADYQTLAEWLLANNQAELAGRFSANLTRPGDAALLRQSALEQLTAEDWAGAGQTLRGLLTLDPQNSEANLWLGLLLWPDPRARPYLEQVAAQPNPNQAVAIAILGMDYQARGVGVRLLEDGLGMLAVRFLSEALAQDGLDHLAYAYRGLARDQASGNGYYDIQNAIALAPDDPLGYYALGLHYRQRGQYDRSQQALSDAQLLDPQNPALVAELGAAFQLTNNLAEAERWYQEAVQLAPEDMRFISLLAAFYADSTYPGASGDAYTQVAQAALIYPQEASLQASWGRMQFHQGELEASAASYALALSLTPDDPRTQFYYAQTLERLGQYEAALAQYTTLTQSHNPYQEAAALGIRRIAG
jgi:Flp pilus assembly protein TadD